MIYLLHFKERFQSYGHYIGHVADKDYFQRIAEHRDGKGIRLFQVAKHFGIDFSVSRLWFNADAAFAKQLKRHGGSARICPICNPEDAMKRGVFTRSKKIIDK